MAQALIQFNLDPIRRNAVYTFLLAYGIYHRGD